MLSFLKWNVADRESTFVGQRRWHSAGVTATTRHEIKSEGLYRNLSVYLMTVHATAVTIVPILGNASDDFCWQC